MAPHDNDHAPSMPENLSIWWTEERVEATICPEFVRAQLSPHEQDRLDGTLAFGDGLTDDTYLERVLTKARRFFLILVEIGAPQHIFSIVDESYDDDDLPFNQEAISQLRFVRGSDASIGQKFFDVQFRYLVTGVREGEHVRYGSNDVVPIETANSRIVLATANKDVYDKVWLPGAAAKKYCRRRVSLDKEPEYFQETEVLEDVVTMKKLSHQHLLSVFGSYTSMKNVFVLFTPAPEMSLKTFLNDPPASFKSLDKKDRRQILVNWPHCLSSALSWLHQQNYGHGSISPTNVLIDANHKVFFGHFNACETLHTELLIDDIESYQYAAPERWVRTAVVHQNQHAKPAVLNSGGRTGRRIPKGKKSASSSGSDSLRVPSAMGDWNDMPSPTSPTASDGVKRPGPMVFNLTADGLRSSSRAAKFQSIMSSSSGGSFQSSASSSGHGSHYQTPASSAASVISSTSSEPRTAFRVPIDLDKFRRPSNASSSSGATTKQTTYSTPTAPNLASMNVSVPAASSHQTIVQTWSSQQANPMPSDVFALAAVTLDIMTVLCKRKLSAFASHRSAKNRTAGRGGGLADASFHANLGQVASWCDTLEHDATKKSDLVFKALPPMLEVVREMITKDPSVRPDAEKVERRFEDSIWRVASVAHLHCRGQRPVKEKKLPPKARANVPKPVLPELRESVCAPLSPTFESQQNEVEVLSSAMGEMRFEQPPSRTRVSKAPSLPTSPMSPTDSRIASSMSLRALPQPRSPPERISSRQGGVFSYASSSHSEVPTLLHATADVPNAAPSPLSKFDFDYDFQLDDLTEVDQELEFQEEQESGEETLHHVHPVSRPKSPPVASIPEFPPSPSNTLPPPYPPPSSKPPTPLATAVPSFPEHKPAFVKPNQQYPPMPQWGMPQPGFMPGYYLPQNFHHPQPHQPQPGQQMMFTAEQVQQMLQQAQQASAAAYGQQHYPQQFFPPNGMNPVHYPPQYSSQMSSPVDSRSGQFQYNNGPRTTRLPQTPDLSRQDSYNADTEPDLEDDDDDDDGDMYHQGRRTGSRRMGEISIQSLSRPASNRSGGSGGAQKATPKVVTTGGGRTKMRVKQPKAQVEEVMPKKPTAGGIPPGMKSFGLFKKK